MNHWHERFQTEAYVYGKEANAFIKEFSHHLPPSSNIAAYAEGEGRNAVYLGKLGHNLTVYDYAQSGLEKAKRLAQEENIQVQTRLVDLMKEPLPTQQFDAAIMVFGHFKKEDQYFVLNKIVKSIKPGGIFMVEVYSEKQLEYGTGGPKKLEMLYNQEEFLEWCQQFSIIHYYAGEATRNEGSLHNGKCHILQAILQV